MTSSANNPMPQEAWPTVAPDLEESPRPRKHKTSIRVPALNITSMMDLTFNLLLFFVLSASFAAAEGVLPAQLPTGTGGSGAAVVPGSPAPPANRLVIGLRYLGGDQVAIQIESARTNISSYEDLYAKLKGWRYDANNPNGQFRPDNPIVIQADRAAPWKHVVEAFNAVVRARYTNVGFAPPRD